MSCYRQFDERPQKWSLPRAAAFLLFVSAGLWYFIGKFFSWLF